MRSRLCFYIRAFRGAYECTWKYRSISSNSLAQLEKRGEIWMSLITCGSIHEGHEWSSDYSRGSQEIFICLAVLFSQRKQLPFFAPGPSGVSRNATRVGSEEGRLFLQAMFYHVSNLPIRERRCQLRYPSSPTSWDHFFFVSLYSAAVQCYHRKK